MTKKLSTIFLLTLIYFVHLLLILTENRTLVYFYIPEVIVITFRCYQVLINHNKGL